MILMTLKIPNRIFQSLLLLQSWINWLFASNLCVRIEQFLDIGWIVVCIALLVVIGLLFYRLLTK